MNWYYAENGKQVGPGNETDFQAAVATAKITPDTLVWHDGLTNWQPYRTVTGAAGSADAASSTSAVCSECGRSFPADAVITTGGVTVCAMCKPVFLQKLKEGVAPTGALQYAGFWIRVGAKLIDSIILSVASMVLLFPLMFLMQSRMKDGDSADTAALIMLAVQVGFQIVWLGVSALYTIFFLGKYGATPGKMACKLKVITPDGGPISYGRACGRFFGNILSGMICYIGYLMVALDKDERRALHDRICGTRVIHR